MVAHEFNGDASTEVDPRIPGKMQVLSESSHSVCSRKSENYEGIHDMQKYDN